MGKIKKITENELVGGTQNTDVYPVTSVKAVYDENNERLDNILNRRGVINISTNYNSDHIAEVLTLKQAINKVPSSDRVLGFQGKYLASDGWHTIIYTGDSLTSWSDETKWIDLADKVFNSISKNATFAGIATPVTNPGTPDGLVFYIATTAGIYTNFSDIEVAEGEAIILQWNGGAWAKEATRFATEQEIIYDVSAHNNGTVFESLQTLLSSSNLSTLIPISVQRGGMTIRYVQTSDNKYVQYRLMANTFSTDEDDWQGVDDEPTAGSENLVKSGGVANKISELEGKVDIAPTSNIGSIDVDLDLTDEEGYVLVKFKNGEVETKYFSSKKTPSQNDIEDYDLVISDENGEGIVGFNNGHIRTKKFDSKNLPSLYEPSMTSQGLSTPVSVVKSSVLLARVVHDFCCCGSSSTIGQVYGYDINSGNSPSASFQDSDNSYGKCLARILDAQCDIVAAGGHTCKSWLSSFKNSLPKHKVYFLWLGLNDSTDSFTDYALGTISDVHVGSEETNANSFYGWYSKVIAHIRSVAPDCLIICLNIPRGYRGEKDGDPASLKMQSYNKAINDVLQLYKHTLYMDLYQYTPRWRDGLLWMQWGHLTPIGYTYFASIVANYLEWLVINHNDSFQRLAYIDKGVYFSKDEVK